MAKRFNKVILTLIISDLFLFFALGLLAPIFAVFVLENIEGSSLEVIGTAAAVYWIARVISVVPIGRSLDKVKGERDEYYSVVVGTFMMALLPLLYIFATKPSHIYMIEMAKGIANSLAIPAWRILFTKFVDRKLVGLAWSLEDISVGLATASSAFIGSIIAERYGFNVVFVLVACIGVVAAVFLIKLYQEERINKSHTGLMAWLRGETTITEQAPLKVDHIK